MRHFEIEPSQLGTTKLFDDDNNPLSTRRLGTGGDLINFSLNNKSELNRNIPFSKLKNMDFTGVPKHKIFSPSKFGRPRRSPDLIERAESIETVTAFLDFENMMKLMSLKKSFREGYTNNPTKYQLQISKIFKYQMRKLLILGLSSTIQRIQFWNFKTKFFYGKKKKPNLYKTLKKLKTNENAAAEIRKDVHRTFPDISYFQ